MHKITAPIPRRRPLLAPRRTYYRLDEALAASLDDARVSTSSLRTYGFHALALADYFGPEKPLDSISPEDVESYQRARIEAGRKPATVNREIAFLGRTYSHAARAGKVYTNPVHEMRMRLIPENNARTRYLTAEEEMRLRAVMDPDDFRIVRVAILTGMRRGELFGLRSRNVRWEARYIYLERSKTGPRSVPLHPEALEILARQAEGVPRDAWLFRGHLPADRQDNRTTVAQRWVGERFKPALRRAGIEDMRFHDLRHTCASRLVMAGARIPVVMAVLGHRRPMTTMRYTHLAPDHLLQEIQRLN